jgi:hypothetical protein
MERLVINRGELLTGTPLAAYGGTGSLREAKSGLKCCLGVYGSALGLSDNVLNGCGILSSINYVAFVSHGVAQPAWLRKPLDAADRKRFGLDRGENNGISVEDTLAHVNDTVESKRHPKRRESAIAYLFHKYGGIEVLFIGSYADGTARWRESRTAVV